MAALARIAQFTALSVCVTALSGCSYFSWLGGSSSKTTPLPKADGAAAIAPAWTLAVGGSQASALVPMVDGGKVYAAHPDGTIVVADEKTGAQLARFSLPQGAGKLSGGVGVGGGLVIVSSQKAEVFAFDANGASKWRVRVPTESIVPAAISDGVVVVPMVDGNIVGLDAKDGSRKWVIQRQIPALTLRAGSIPVAVRGGGFIGTPTGRLLAFDLATGAVGWEATVANPKGASELERLIDIAGRPSIDAQRACASAYQGRVACFDLQRGTPIWSRDIGSLTGTLLDDKYVYVVDDKGSAYALDRSTGGTIWKQDVLAGRIATGVALAGENLVVIDNEGNVHSLNKATGRIVARSLGTTKISGGMAQGASFGYALTGSGQLVAFGAR